jgi:hypothetical protein
VSDVSAKHSPRIKEHTQLIPPFKLDVCTIWFFTAIPAKATLSLNNGFTENLSAQGREVCDLLRFLGKNRAGGDIGKVHDLKGRASERREQVLLEKI